MRLPTNILYVPRDAKVLRKWWELYKPQKDFYSTSYTRYFLTDRIASYHKLEKDHDTVLNKHRKDLFPLLRNGNTACFASVVRDMCKFVNSYGSLPEVLVYRFDEKCKNKDKETYLKLCDAEGLLGKVDIEKILEVDAGIVMDPAEYNLGQIFFILSNFRALNEHPRLVDFVVWANREQGKPASEAFIGATFAGYAGNYHHYLPSGYDINNRSQKELDKWAWRVKNYISQDKREPIRNDWTTSSFRCNATLGSIVVPANL